MDTLTITERSQRMRMVKSQGTGPEQVVCSLARKLGYRFLIHDARLPGHPDLAFPGRRKAIFVHGCFWHRHNACHLARMPKSRLDFWRPKLERNKARDAITRRALTRIGWSSLVVWECELSDPAKVMSRVLVFLEE